MVDDGVFVAEISLTEFAITGTLAVPAGPVVLSVTNFGSAEHNLQFNDGPITPMLGTNRSAVLDLGTLRPGTYPMTCEISGHKEAGMTATLTVLDADDPELATVASSHGDGTHGGDVDWAEMDRIMLESIRAFPAETTGIGNQILEAVTTADGTKEFHLTSAITPWEVEPGKIVDAWTYNGQVPGPIIRVDVGDPDPRPDSAGYLIHI